MEREWSFESMIEFTNAVEAIVGIVPDRLIADRIMAMAGWQHGMTVDEVATRITELRERSR